jgi:hypothetical protein
MRNDRRRCKICKQYIDRPFAGQIVHGGVCHAKYKKYLKERKQKDKQDNPTKQSTLMQIARQIVHKHVRERDKDKGCITCGKPFDDGIHELQAGHYIHGSRSSALRFNTNNIHGQCKQCNYYLDDMERIYRQKLIERIGIDEVLKLESAPRLYSWTTSELQEIIDKFR